MSKQPTEPFEIDSPISFEQSSTKLIEDLISTNICDFKDDSIKLTNNIEERKVIKDKGKPASNEIKNIALGNDQKVATSKIVENIMSRPATKSKSKFFEEIEENKTCFSRFNREEDFSTEPTFSTFNNDAFSENIMFNSGLSNSSEKWFNKPAEDNLQTGSPFSFSSFLEPDSISLFTDEKSVSKKGNRSTFQ